MAAPSLERMIVMTPDTNLSGSAVRSGKGLENSSSIGGRNAREEKRNRTRRIFRTTYHRPSPATAASIPSRYQTFFAANTEQRGFNSQEARFHGSALTGTSINDTPGPGTYMPRETCLEQVAPSFSKRGTGGFASKASRFPRVLKGKIGPGYYNPLLPDSHVNFSRATVSSNFQNPIVAEGSKHSQHSPAPNSYNLTKDPTAKNTLVAAQAAFKSRTQRQPCLLHALSNPGPGQYDVKVELVSESSCPQQAVFLSNTKRVIPLELNDPGPGPADYKPTPSSPHTLHVPYHKQKHYLCISAPAIPLPPCPSSPGPGHYETHQPAEVPNQLVSGAVFKSTTGRWGRQPAMTSQPGPGSYDVQADVHKSFLCNLHHKWI